MANPEHLQLLTQGVKVWNKWRKKHSAVGPDFREADLHGLNLGGANFSLALNNEYVVIGAAFAGADVIDVVENGNARRADFRKANLIDARLYDANLFGADLCEANLRSADLTKALLASALLNRASLHKAKLYDADLGGSDLRDANLSEAKLYGADLREAWLDRTYFGGASLRQADFRNAHLNNTDFTKADLTGVNFSNAYLNEVNFSQALLGSNIFSFTNLSTVRGLETAKHSGPSSIGIETIYRSKGNIPEPFLRGCGVPEEFIIYMQSLTAQPIQFYSCFISYSSKDQDLAERLYADLQNKGVRCWIAAEDLRIGDKFRDRIDESIRLYDKVLLILSEHSVSSEWVGDEVEAAFERERRENRTVLFPIQIDDAVTESVTGWAAAIRRRRHIGDFRLWKSHDDYQKSFARLLRDLKAEGGQAAEG